MTPTPKMATGAAARAGAGDPAVPAADVGPFVLNLHSSSTPVALEAAAQLPELKRFTFFVSRRLEEGRERFRLHMGYFSTLDEAEEWLNVVRDIYPGAWAGEAPGKKLRERAAAASQAAAASAPQVQAPKAMPQQAARQAVATAPQTPVPPSVVNSRPLPNIVVPTLQAAGPIELAPTVIPVVPPVARPAPVASSPVAKVAVPAARVVTATGAAVTKVVASVARPAAPPAMKSQAAAAARVPAPASAKTPVPAARSLASAPRAAAPSQVAQPATRNPVRPAASSKSVAAPVARPVAGPTARPPAAAAKSVARPTKSPNKAAGLASSNVREVLAALDETTGETRVMPAPSLPPMPLSVDDPALSDTQVLRFLETRRDDTGDRPTVDAESGISLLKPDDTGTRRALKEAVVQNAPVSFAVQLQWSVQPVALDNVPPLAIFSAYTLYTVEGSRDGRRWYGLRLGFFSDAISAKQVAYYIRSEFASVAVVPVSPQERERATEDDKKTSSLAFPKKTRQQPVDEFKLIDSDDQPASPGIIPKPRPAPAPKAAAPAGGRRSGGGRVRAREQRAPQTLEETLEILGASQLQIDNGRGESLNESGIRHLHVEVQKNTPFRRLLDRLSERVKKS